MTWRVPLFRIFWDQQDIDAVSRVLTRGTYWAEGPEISGFERALCDYSGRSFCTVFNSGTSALHATLIAYEIGPGDEVIVPSFTFIATANAPHFVGARPVFADIEPLSMGLDPEDVAEKISPSTRVIIPVHYGGIPCRIRALRDLAEDHGILLIEDAAEAFGAMTGPGQAGTFGNAGMFSFCQNKIITTGEGGAIVSDDPDLHRRLELLRSHGREGGLPYFSSTSGVDYTALGYNFRLPTMGAALGISQLSKAEWIISRRRELAAEYAHAFLHLDGVSILPEPAGERAVYQLYSVRCRNRDALQSYLAAKGIMTKVYFPPVHQSAFYRRDNRAVSLPRTEEVASDILTLPLFPSMTMEEHTLVVNTVREFYHSME